MTYHAHLDICSQLRFASQNVYDESRRDALRDIANEIDVAIKTLVLAPTGHNMTVLNGCWIAGTRALEGGQPYTVKSA